MRPQRVHNLRGNKRELSPHRLFVWDVETRPLQEGRREVLTPRVWAAETVQRHGRRPTQPRVEEHRGQDPTGIADMLEASCRASETIWAFAHNQSFDLAAVRLPLQLLSRGWTITAHALATDSPWARLSKGSHRIVLADSASWLPGPLEAIGLQVGIDKPPLPAEDADEHGWFWRCRQDVRILSLALCQLMDWWDEQHCGSWSVTGPQSGFNLMRHKPTPHTVVIDPDPDARAFERAGLLGGRREVWRLGRLPWGDYRELDFRSAHATVAAHCPLPKRRSVRFESMDLDDWRIMSGRWAPMAYCTIRTNTPRYPVQYRGRLFYPIGSFRTILCGPELAEARRRGELLSVGPGYVYQLGQHMGDWGRWVLKQLDGKDPSTPPVALTAIKAWSRRVPGKWASRVGQVIHTGTAAEQGWNLEHGRHHPSGAPVAVLDMAGQRTIHLQDQDADDCFPAVLAWIQSEVRVRLGRLIDMVGAERMVSCNTDGLFCEGTSRLMRNISAEQLAPLTVREKQRVPWLDVISPQHLILPHDRRLAGVPGSAEEVGYRKYRWMTWPRMPTQIASGEPRGYVREPRAVDLSGVPVNRWVGRDQTAFPVTAMVGEDGATRFLPAVADLLGHGLGVDAQRQHPALRRVLDGR